MGELIRIPDSDRPMCPNAATGPLNQYHTQVNAILNTISHAFEQDEDTGEFLNPIVTEVYNKISDRMSIYMYLHKDTSMFPLTTGKYMESYYFKCHTCGFVLPASIKDLQ